MLDPMLEEILTQPSAPFRELHVIRVLKKALEDGQVPHFVDPIGNIVVGASSKADYLALIRSKARPKTPGDGAEPVRVFIAHMDHPGFHGVRWKSDRELEFKWHGGSPTQLLEGAAVWLATSSGPAGHGKVLSASLSDSKRAIEKGVVETPPELRLKTPDATHVYGGFSFRSPVWQEGNVLYTKAADDLVGSYAIVRLAIELFKSRPGSRATGRVSKPARGTSPGRRPPFLGLLTRAEEVGFIGAIGHFELGWLAQARRPVLCVSLETSRQLPGAEIGKGPVVRLGDKSTTFSTEALHVFTEVARAVLPDKHQRRVMDGGTCEATAATAYGFKCVGISIPLGNYHNQSFEGGPDASGSLGPAPEFVDLQDVQGLLTLCHGLMKDALPWHEPWKAKLKSFKSELKNYRPLLRTGP